MATATFGCFFLGAALVGYLFREIGPIQRVLMGLAAIGLLIPIQSQFFTITLFSNIIGGGLALLLLVWGCGEDNRLGGKNTSPLPFWAILIITQDNKYRKNQDAYRSI
jgi:hypothetical protein